MRGTADVDGAAYLHLLPHTPSRLSSFRSMDGRTERVIEFGRCLRTIFSPVCGDVDVFFLPGPCTTTSFDPQRELPPARLVIHRTDLCQHNVGNAEGCNRGQASVFLPPATLAADNGRAPHYQRAPRGSCYLGRGAATPLSVEFRARNPFALEHVDIVAGHGSSGVPLSSPGLHQ